MLFPRSHTRLTLEEGNVGTFMEVISAFDLSVIIWRICFRFLALFVVVFPHL